MFTQKIQNPGWLYPGFWLYYYQPEKGGAFNEITGYQTAYSVWRPRHLPSKICRGDRFHTIQHQPLWEWTSHSHCRALAKICGLFRCVDGLYLRSLWWAARQAVSSKASGGKQPGTRKVCGDVLWSGIAHARQIESHSNWNGNGESRWLTPESKTGKGVADRWML